MFSAANLVQGVSFVVIGQVRAEKFLCKAENFDISNRVRLLSVISTLEVDALSDFSLFAFLVFSFVVE